MSVKQERLASQIKKEVSYIIMKEVKDELIKNIIVTDVNLSNDLSFAKVYYIISDKNTNDQVAVSLNNAAAFIRSKLADQIEMRHVPELKFIYDEAIEYAEKIEEIINKLKEE